MECHYNIQLPVIFGSAVMDAAEYNVIRMTIITAMVK